MRLAISIVCGLALATSVAHGQGAGPPGTAPTTPPPAPAPVTAPAGTPAPEEVATPPTTVDPGTVADANSGRVALMSTALTPPAGSFSFEDWELFLISAGYAVTDQLVITATTMVPVTSDFYWGFVSAKLQVLKTGRVRLAAQAGVAGFLDNQSSTDGASSSNDSASGFDLGGAATLCLDDGCFSHVDASVVAGFAWQNQSSVPVGFAGGIVGKVARKIRIVAEADSAHMFGDISGQANGFLGWYGLRFTSRDIGVDLELVKPFCSDCSTKEFPLGFPWVTFTYRSL